MSEKAHLLQGPVRPALVPCRVQLSRRKGWRMPPNTVKVCRPGKFGNPYVVGVDGTAAECVEKFAKDIFHINGRVDFEVEDVATLRGKNLACWCNLDAPCHADTLLALANDEPNNPLEQRAKDAGQKP